jgi:hypothetical protein
MGEAETQLNAEMHVQAVIDRAISIQEALQQDKRTGDKV